MAEINMEDYYLTGEARRKLKLQQYQLDFLLENGYLTRINKGKSFLLKKTDVEKFPKERVLKLMEDWRTESRKVVNDLNKQCLFCFKGWDEKAFEFCDLVERGYDAEAIMKFMKISPRMKPYVVDKIKYLRES
ncbi:MAG: hypothetical protein ACRCZH_03300 [Cetobacterium sp.]